MSFGSPGGRAINIKPSPPERGSFPLDHDSECKHLIANYISCIKKNRGVNEDACRLLARGYLACRMDRNLMARDEWRNLGLPDLEGNAKAEAGELSGNTPGADTGPDPGAGNTLEKNG